MTDPTTPFLGLIKPIVGEEAGEDLWGAKWNQNADILDAYMQSSGGVAEAPLDGQIYGRRLGDWAVTITQAEFTSLGILVNDIRIDLDSLEVTVGAIDWTTLPGKPATFPPTLPIPSSGVTGLDAKQAAQDAAIAAKPDEAPTDGQLYSRKGSTASWIVASAGAVVSDTAPVGTPVSTIWWNSASGGLFIDYQDPNSRQWVMVNAAGMPEAPKDTKQYARKNGAWSEVVIPTPPTPPIATDAPADSKSYARRNNAWFDLTASFASKADATALANYVPMSGATMTAGSGLAVGSNGFSTSGNIAASGGITANGAMSCVTGFVVSAGYLSVTAAGGNHGGVMIGSGAGAGALGYPAGNGIYGGLSYQGYGLYSPYSLYVGGAGTFAGAISVAGNCIVTGILQSTHAGNNTSTNSANCTIGTNGTLGRTTSSVAYKTDIELMEDEYADKVLLLEPIFYRPGPNTVDRQDWSRFGFSAEGAYAADFRFSYCEEGALISYEKITEEHPTDEWTWWNACDETTRGPEPVRNYIVERQGPAVYDDTVTPVQHDLNAIVAALLNVVKRQNARIAALEAASGV